MNESLRKLTIETKPDILAFGMGSRAFVYLRKTHKDAENLRETIASLAAEKSIDVVKSFVDPAQGAVLGNGMNFLQMLVQLHAGEAEVLIMDRLSSFSTDMVEQELVLANLRTSGISVVCLEDLSLSCTDPERRLLRDFSSRSDFMKRLEGLRLTGKRIAARKRVDRKKEGARPYGDLAGEDRVLSQIRELTAQNMGPAAIARQLNDQGILPRRGKRWHPTTIANILGARRTAAKRKAKRRVQKQ